MKTKIIYIILFIFICVSVIAFNSKNESPWVSYYELGKDENALPCQAYKETRYRGPLDTTYNPYLTSKAGAVGAMQIMPRYASYFAGFPVTKKQVMHDLELNVWLSMKILSQHYKAYKDWTLACGTYNTGRPILNGYAKYCGSTKNFTNQWVGPDSLKTQFSLGGL